MSERKIIKCLFPAVLLIVFGILQVSAQEELRCSLQINVFEFGNASAQVENVKIALTSSDKKTKVEPEPLTGAAALFNNLSSGKYKIETSKDGFQRRVKQIEIDCAVADSDGKVFEHIYLWKGSSKEITKLPADNSFRAVSGVEASDEVKASAGKSVENSALKLAKPAYPGAAKAVRAAGTIAVQVTIDEDGNVISAEAVEGHPLLRAAAVKAARQSKFLMTLLSGVPVKVMGIITYNFIAQ